MDRKNNVERLASICRRSWRPWRCGATGGGGLWLGRSGPERPWNWLTGTDTSLDDLLSGGSRKVEESFGRIDPDDVRPTPDLPDRDPRNVLTDTWRVVPDDRLVTFEPGGLPKSWRISAVRHNAANLSLVVNDPVTGEPVEPDLMALLRDGCFDFDRSRETPEWQDFWRSERGTVAYRDVSGLVRRWTPGMMKPTHGKGNANRGHGALHLHSQLSYTGLATFGRLRSKPLINMASNR